MVSPELAGTIRCQLGQFGVLQHGLQDTGIPSTIGGSSRD